MIILVKLWNNNESKQRTITSCMRNLKAANQYPLQYNTLYENLSKEVIALISTNVTHPPLSQKCLVSGLVQLRLWFWWRTWASEKYMTTTRTPLTTTNNDIWFSNRKNFRYVKMKINECNAIISFFQLIPRYLQETKKKKNTDHLFATIYFLQNWNDISIIFCANYMRSDLLNQKTTKNAVMTFI